MRKCYEKKVEVSESLMKIYYIIDYAFNIYQKTLQGYHQTDSATLLILGTHTY